MPNTDSAPSIVVAATGAHAYDVDVRAAAVTRHHVTVSPAYLQKLGVDAHPTSRVVHEAFVFLLEREPNTSILTSFDLREIERYFPEFPREIAARLRS